MNNDMGFVTNSVSSHSKQCTITFHLDHDTYIKKFNAGMSVLVIFSLFAIFFIGPVIAILSININISLYPVMIGVALVGIISMLLFLVSRDYV